MREPLRAVQIKSFKDLAPPVRTLAIPREEEEEAQCGCGRSGTEAESDGGAVAEPFLWSDLLRGVAGESPWVRDPAELGRLAHAALGLDPQSSLVPVALPGSALGGPVHPGDLLLRSAPAAAGRYVAVIISDETESSASLAARGVPVESAGPGEFVEVLEAPYGGGVPHIVGRRLTDPYGRVLRQQTVLRPASAGEQALEESIQASDIAVEMAGLRCRFLQLYRASRGTESRTFAQDAILFIEDWHGNGAEATVDGFSVPKLVITPYTDTVEGVRRYDTPLAAQRTAVGDVARSLRDWVAREASYQRNHITWQSEKERLESLFRRKGEIYSDLWIHQMMFNRFDGDFARWTRHYNRELGPATPLDPNIVKSMAYQESRLGTSGRHLMPPPYDWNDADHHPIRSRFNLLQAIDSWGPQQWLMMREMAPDLFRRHHLDALEARSAWLGMSNDDYAAHPTFMRALREFFELRVGGNNLMGSAGRSLHEDYGFWIRTGIRWLFEKFHRLARPTWLEAVRAYNGSGPHAQTYRERVMARVGGDGPLAVSDVEGEETEAEDFPELPKAPSLDRSARLEWEDQTRVPDSHGDPQVFYVVTGAPAGRAAAGDEGKAIFHLRVHNTNSVYNHQDVVTKVRLLSAGPNRQFREVMPWKSERGSELEDESSRVIKLSLLPRTLAAAYDSDAPLSRIELEYHWREAGESRARHYNRTGLDFMLMAPIEFLLSQRRRISKDVLLNDPAAHKADYWIPLGGVEFTPNLREPITVTVEVTSTVRQEASADRTTTAGTSQSKTQSHTSSNTFNLQLTGEASESRSGKAEVGIFELGLTQLIKLGASLGYSRSTTNTSSTTTAREFSQSLRLSRTYAATQATTSRFSFQISPATATAPTGTGTRGHKRTGASVGAYIYPVVVYHEVPFVRYANINRFGQATSRQAGTVTLPFITEWRYTTLADEE
jgi:hypothetical protein